MYNKMMLLGFSCCAWFSLVLVAVLAQDDGHVYTDDWQLVFHAVNGNGKNVKNAWTTNSSSDSPCTPDSGCIPPGFSLHYWKDTTKHLRSPLIDQWDYISILKIRVVLGGQGKTLAFLEFDGSGSDKLNWFSKSRLLHSSWSDLKTANTNYFSIEGHDSDAPYHLRRHFYVNQLYAGCPNDPGWFVVLDKTDEVCPWARKGNFPVFLFSTGSQVANWNNNPGVADVMNVYIQTL